MPDSPESNIYQFRVVLLGISPIITTTHKNWPEVTVIL